MGPPRERSKTCSSFEEAIYTPNNFVNVIFKNFTTTVLRPTIFLKKEISIYVLYWFSILLVRNTFFYQQGFRAFTIVPLEHYVFVCPLNSFLLHDRSNDVCSLLSMIESCWDFALCTLEWRYNWMIVRSTMQWLLCKQCLSSLCRCTRFMQKRKELFLFFFIPADNAIIYNSTISAFTLFYMQYHIIGYMCIFSKPDIARLYNKPSSCKKFHFSIHFLLLFCVCIFRWNFIHYFHAMLKVLLSIFPYKTGNSHLAYEISDTFLPFITVSRSRYAFRLYT